MRKLALLVTLIMGAAAVTHAIDLGVFGSHWNPDEGDEAIGVGGSIHFEFLPLELRATLFPDTTIRGVGDSLLLPLDLGLALNLTRSQKVDVYAGAGVSYYIVDTDHGDPDNEIGWYVLGRLEVPTDMGVNVFCDVMYRSVELDDVDVDLGGVCINLGLIFR